jgi:dihydroorotase-like cyclic amidohydrolase
VTVSGGKIAGVLSAGVAVEGLRTIDAAGKYVLPGGVEPHTHLGLYLPFDQDLPSETRSAAAGGITTVFHFNQSTDLYRNVLRSQIEAVEGNAYVDVAYNCIINRPDHLDELDYLIENGITSFKFCMNSISVLGCLICASLAGSCPRGYSGHRTEGDGHVLAINLPMRLIVSGMQDFILFLLAAWTSH